MELVLSEAERRLMKSLRAAMGQFAQLPSRQPSELDKFVWAIIAAQAVVVDHAAKRIAAT